jgi:hypothetical protein
MEILWINLLIGYQRVVSPKDQRFQRFSYTCTGLMISHTKDRYPQRHIHDGPSFTTSQKSNPITSFVRNNENYW